MKIIILLLCPFLIFAKKADVNVNVNITVTDNSKKEKENENEGEKKKKPVTLKDAMKEVIEAEGQQRIDAIQKLEEFEHSKVVSQIITTLQSEDISSQTAAAEASGIIKDKRYEKIIQKIIQDVDDDQLLETLLFSIGSNKFLSLTSYICSNLKSPKINKQSFSALTFLKTDCETEVKEILKSTELKERMTALEYIMKTQNKAFKDDVIEILKNDKGGILFSASLALLSMDEKDGADYVINYFNNEITDSNLKYKNLKSLNELIKDDNKSIIAILKDNIKTTSFKVKLFCSISIVLRGKINELSQEEIEFIEDNKDTDDTSLIPIVAKYNVYMKKQKNKK